MLKQISLASGIAVLLTALSCERNISLPDDSSLAFETEQTTLVEKTSFVTKDQALNAADLFMGSKCTVPDTRTAETESPGPSTVQTIDKDGKPLMYVVNYDEGGFVIISATRDYMPVLAYSEDGFFDVSSIQGGLSLWVDETMSAVETSGEPADSVKRSMNRLWRVYEEDVTKAPVTAVSTRSTSSTGFEACVERCEELTNEYWDEGWTFTSLDNARYAFEEAGFLDVYEQICYSAEFNNSALSSSVVGWKMGSSYESYGPMLQTQWHQGWPYNSLCETHPAGCGVIALAQVMKYHDYPQSLEYEGYFFYCDAIPVEEDALSKQMALIRLVREKTGTTYLPLFDVSWATPEGMVSGIEYFDYNVIVENENYRNVENEILHHHRPVIMLGHKTNSTDLPGSLEYIGNSHYWVVDGVRKTESDIFMVFAEWQPNDCGEFTQSYYSIDNPNVVSGVTTLYYHYNIGWGDGYDGWFVFNHYYPYLRKTFYLSIPLLSGKSSGRLL